MYTTSRISTFDKNDLPYFGFSGLRLDDRIAELAKLGSADEDLRALVPDLGSYLRTS